MLLRYLLGALAVSTAMACAQPERKGSAVICDAQGCTERSRNHALAPPPPSAAEEEASRQLAALQDLARQDARAAFDLGLRYFRGDGVRQNSHQALNWMRDAAERGDLEAQKALGRFYLTGLEEMGADPREAEKWLTITSGRGDEESAVLLKEATAAKHSEQALYDWRQRWRPIFYRHWYYGYRYRTYWRHGYWLYY